MSFLTSFKHPTDKAAYLLALNGAFLRGMATGMGKSDHYHECEERFLEIRKIWEELNSDIQNQMQKP